MQCRSFDLRNEPLSDFDSQVRSRPLSDAGRRCGKSRVSGHDRDPRQRADAGPEVDRATAVEVRVDDATVAPIALRGWEQRALRGALRDRERPLYSGSDIDCLFGVQLCLNPTSNSVSRGHHVSQPRGGKKRSLRQSRLPR